jgi:hypothetical protein
MTDPAPRPKPNAGKGPAPAPRPGAQPARPAGQQPARPAAGQPARPAPAARPAPQPAPRPRVPEPVEEEEPAPVRRPVRRGGNQQAEELDPTTKKGLIAAGVMVVIAAVVWTVVSNQKKAQRDKEDAFEKMLQTFKSEIETVVNNEHADAAAVQAAIDRIDKEPEKWQDHKTEGDIRGDKSRLTGKLESIRRETEFRAAYKDAKEAVENSASRSIEELVKTRQKLGEIEGSAEQYDPAYPQQIKDWKVKLDHLLVGKWRDETKAFVAMSSTTAHQGLAKYAEAEDYVRKAMLDAHQAKNKADDEAYTQIYKDLLKDSDEYSEKVITPEFKNSIPWKDLLSGEMATRWSKSTTVPGFAVRIDGGTLTVSPPDPGSKQQGVAGIFDQKQDNLRFFELDMEFAVEGIVTMFFHVSPAPQNPDNRQSHSFDLVVKEGQLTANKKYNMHADYIGSTLSLTFPPIGNEDPIGAWSPDPSWTKLRRGGLAFLIPEGARLKITRLKIRELR